MCSKGGTSRIRHASQSFLNHPQTIVRPQACTPLCTGPSSSSHLIGHLHPLGACPALSSTQHGSTIDLIGYRGKRLVFFGRIPCAIPGSFHGLCPSILPPSVQVWKPQTLLIRLGMGSSFPFHRVLGECVPVLTGNNSPFPLQTLFSKNKQ